MIISKYFNESEFQSCTPGCSLQDMKQRTISKLDTAREIVGIPFSLSSAFRSDEWDISRGRTGTGSHTLGQAVDIRCTNQRDRFLMICALLQAGFNRIGIGDTFIHADDSEVHTQNLIWVY